MSGAAGFLLVRKIPLGHLFGGLKNPFDSAVSSNSNLFSQQQEVRANLRRSEFSLFHLYNPLNCATLA
jgi:hypothetical protein